MINAKSIIGVIIVAILVGVLYVVFEKNFAGEKILSDSQTSSSEELTKEIIQTTQKQSSLLNLPIPDPTSAPVTESSNLLQEGEGLQMRDYSSYFEQLKESVSKP